MFLEEIIIKNFRGYRECRIEINNLTTFIGKNDVGKSTIFEALNIFFNDPASKNIDASDFCKFSGDVGEIRIGCIFSKLPDEVIIDKDAVTTLKGEYLVNKDGRLEIHKVYNFYDDKLSKQKIVAIARHPNAQWCKNLLIKKISELKDVARECGVYEQIKDLRTKPEIRQTIWEKDDDLEFKSRKEIELAKEDAGEIWKKLSEYLPQFALFAADRTSRDEDEEVQDPLKIAIEQARKKSQAKLDEVKNEVREYAEGVAKKTIEQLKIFNPALAENLNPHFKSEPKWDSIFKLSLRDDNGISLNKRGSGMRRLILFSFFKAEAERLLSENQKESIIYAIEEPETAQHPENQRMVIKALKDISENDGCQVMLTTHLPDIALLLPVESMRYIYLKDGNNRKIESPSEHDPSLVLRKIIMSLGILPDRQVKALLCLEGIHDIEFITNMSKLFHDENNNIIDLNNDHRITLIPMGGSGTLQHYADGDYLKHLNLPKVYILDRDKLKNDGTHQYQNYADEIENRDDGSVVIFTEKLEIENYLHIDAINAVFEPMIGEVFDFEIDDDSKVKEKIKTFLKGEKFNLSENIKKLLNGKVANQMTIELLKKRGGYEEIKEWLEIITELANKK